MQASLTCRPSYIWLLNRFMFPFWERPRLDTPRGGQVTSLGADWFPGCRED